MRLSEALISAKKLYAASRPLLRRQMLGSCILAFVFFSSIPLTIILAALNSPLCVPTIFIAFFSPFGLLLLPGLRRAATEPLELYQGKPVPAPDGKGVVFTKYELTMVDFSDPLSQRNWQTTYWVVLEVTQAYRITAEGEVAEFTPSATRLAFQIFPRLSQQIGGLLLPDQEVVLAVTPPLKWIFWSHLIIGRLEELQAAANA